VAVGGLNEADGTATVISTADGGTTWTRSGTKRPVPDPGVGAAMSSDARRRC